ncbi:TetR family transcriptional regulator C-terminal domain-containing protein [Phyllobacterium sp. 21LDTY02-6]|uniref:TetR family transcriptional regulator C-terminal domain-containing protein n=1 Tax=unclassified Phyllobacterium TaxID=2638441 RepID=UPI0020203904|nr:MULTISPECIES: TetR family transcriptional regulator C-terminal domain-containing protein [unclassified Phyllobacterium]MCO4316434.1 TetR family transcriptional regulator C-terminal domain-containing protein [Phyllobacterium sp. 21LDTY02-6]MCX8280764.1 TetR family transcriptional regulator C-terminal domain-containing protein [Phyllobacterium sp. 0TCS1.6C]MCX8292659.1 TetR family transcriptional regulator C-terminal domain-containing protein [Phyllobacterium sp. 0TCS1.6A]
MKPQPATRKSFRREGEDKRREDLIAATLQCVAERGLAGATVREIALRADVTPGLIRYYFPAKDDLIGAAYRAVMGRMTVQAGAALLNADDNPRSRLAAFVTANLGAPIMDPHNLSLWAGFIGLVHADAAMAAAHRDGYLGFRDELEALIRAALLAEGKPAAPAITRRHAIAINAVIDGLWLEGCLAGDIFSDGELAATGIGAIEAILGISLTEGGAQ